MTEETQPWRPGDEAVRGDSSGDGALLDGRYRLGDRLGGGAVADVFRAFDERLQRSVAVKVFRGDAAEQLQRHDDEMRTLARLQHPALVTVFDAGTDDGGQRPYLVMQLVEGPTLAAEMRHGPLRPDRLAQIGAELADALGYVHDQGFVHRDVKPANVLLSPDGRAHLADFGIARLVDSAHVTRTGEILGTPAYFAPEQVAGELVGPPADIYALGLLLLEALTGRRAFEGTAMEVAMARLARDPEVPGTLPRDWQLMLRAMTARDPARRPSAAEVGESLRRLAAGLDVDRTVVMGGAPVAATAVIPPTAMTSARAPARPAPRPTRRRWPLLLVVVILAIAAAAIGVGVAQHQNSAPPTSTYTPGKPTLPAELERDMQRLEKLVRR